MAWWIYASIAALVWGLHYNLIAKTLTVASPVYGWNMFDSTALYVPARFAYSLVVTIED